MPNRSPAASTRQHRSPGRLRLAAATLVGIASTSASAEVLHSRQEALKLAFPEADRVERKHLFLDERQIEQVERAAGSRPPSKILTVYAGYKADRLLGHAFIDTHTVRTLPETFLLVVSPAGTVQRVLILAFHEPPEYRPPERWLGQFRGRGIGAERTTVEVAGLAGATLSARAITVATRKLLVLHRVLGLTQPAATAMTAPRH